MNIYEKELGWIFWTWKLSNYAETNELPSAYYWSLSLAINNGYIDIFDRYSINNSCNYDPDYPELSIIKDSKEDSIFYLYIFGLLFFIAFAIISYNITKCCIKYYRNNEIRTMLNDEYNKIHNKLYNYKYSSVQNDDDSNHDTSK